MVSMGDDKEKPGRLAYAIAILILAGSFFALAPWVVVTTLWYWSLVWRLFF